MTVSFLAQLLRLLMHDSIIIQAKWMVTSWVMTFLQNYTDPDLCHQFNRACNVVYRTTSSKIVLFAVIMVTQVSRNIGRAFHLANMCLFQLSGWLLGTVLPVPNLMPMRPLLFNMRGGLAPWTTRPYMEHRHLCWHPLFYAVTRKQTGQQCLP